MKYLKLCEGGRTIVDDEDYVWLKKFNWRLSPSGYARLNIRYSIYLHRFIFGCNIKYCGMVVDHVNGNKLDNRKSNLRFGSHQKNMFNRKANQGRKYKGVYYVIKQRKWRACIAKNGKQRHLGSFTTELKAAREYNRAAIKLFGNYAHLNKVNNFKGMV